MELLLHLWDKAWEGLAQAEARFEQGGRRKRPRHIIGARCSCIGGVQGFSIMTPFGRSMPLSSSRLPRLMPDSAIDPIGACSGMPASLAILLLWPPY